MSKNSNVDKNRPSENLDEVKDESVDLSNLNDNVLNNEPLDESNNTDDKTLQDDDKIRKTRLKRFKKVESTTVEKPIESEEENKEKEEPKEEEETPEQKDRRRFSKITQIIVEILFIPIVIIAFFSAFTMSSAKANNKAPSIMGNSIVTVLTNSMEPTYMVGSVLLIDQFVPVDEIEVGTPLAFYAPKRSGFIDNKGNSLIVFHRVVRIIYAKNKQGNMVRYFVCHGDNAGPLYYTKVKEPGTGDYRYNAVTNEYELYPGGDYVVKLMNDTDVIAEDYTVTQINSLNQSTIQYVEDQYVIGTLKMPLGTFLTKLIKFVTSSIGIIALVIFPCGVMIIVIINNMIEESKEDADEEEKSAQYDKNIKLLKKASQKEKEKHETVIETEEIELTEKEKHDKLIDEVTAEFEKKEELLKQQEVQEEQQPETQEVQEETEKPEKKNFFKRLFSKKEKPEKEKVEEIKEQFTELKDKEIVENKDDEDKQHLVVDFENGDEDYDYDSEEDVDLDLDADLDYEDEEDDDDDDFDVDINGNIISKEDFEPINADLDLDMQGGRRKRRRYVKYHYPIKKGIKKRKVERITVEENLEQNSEVAEQ